MSWEEVVPGGKRKKAGSLLDLVTLRFVTSGFEISACSSVKDAHNGTHKVLGPMCTMADAWVPAVLCVAEPCWARIPACLFRSKILRTDYSTSPGPSFPVFKAHKKNTSWHYFSVVRLFVRLEPRDPCMLSKCLNPGSTTLAIVLFQNTAWDNTHCVQIIWTAIRRPA